jgi:4,5-DOPA dioxygenase extradiol
MSTVLPALFIGHGSPMNAIEPSRWADAWRAIAAATPRPRAILCISAHWYTRGSAVTAMPHPRTIHDFYGFPPALFACQYPAPGDPALAAQVRQLLAPAAVQLDESEWGLDHGSWSVLLHMYPEAGIPVLQLSLDGTLAPRAHYELARRLAPLREAGVLILGSGNVVHNLRLMQRDPAVQPYDWAVRFNNVVRRAVLAGDHDSLLDFERGDADARRSMPTPEHYLPLLYVLAQQRAGEAVTVPIDGLELGAISMLSVAVGGDYSALQKQ